MPYNLADFTDVLRQIREEAANGTYDISPFGEPSDGWPFEVGFAVAMSVWGLSLSACCCLCYLKTR